MNHISSAAAPTDPFKESLVFCIYILKYLPVLLGREQSASLNRQKEVLSHHILYHNQTFTYFAKANQFSEKTGFIPCRYWEDGADGLMSSLPSKVSEILDTDDCNRPGTSWNDIRGATKQESSSAKQNLPSKSVMYMNSLWKRKDSSLKKEYYNCFYMHWDGFGHYSPWRGTNSFFWFMDALRTGSLSHCICFYKTAFYTAEFQRIFSLKWSHNFKSSFQE